MQDQDLVYVGMEGGGGAIQDSFNILLKFLFHVANNTKSSGLTGYTIMELKTANRTEQIAENM